MKVPSLLSDTFLLLTGAQPIRSGEREPGSWSSPGRVGSRILTLQRAEQTWRHAGGRPGPGLASARDKVKDREGQKGGLQSAWACRLCMALRTCGRGRPRAAPGWVGATGLPRSWAAAWEADAKGISHPGSDARAFLRDSLRTALFR